MRQRLLSSLCLLVTTAISAHAIGASFDCSKAKSQAELQICSSALLSAQDEEIAHAFADALRASPNPGPFRDDQRQWLKMRDRCAAIGPDCAGLDFMLPTRLQELRAPIAKTYYDFRWFTAGVDFGGFTSPTAETLWWFISKTELASEIGWSEGAFREAKFARIGSSVFLVLFDKSLYVADISLKTFRAVRRGPAPATFDLPIFYTVPGHQAWVLLHGSQFQSHAFREWFSAITFHGPREAPAVQTDDFATFDASAGGLCGTEVDSKANAQPATAERVLRYSVFPAVESGSERIEIATRFQDCKTRESHDRVHTYMVANGRIEEVGR